MVKYLLFFTNALLLCQSVVSQNEVDSLTNELQKKIQDTTRVNIYNQFFYTDLYYSDIDKVKDYLHQSLELGRKIDFKKGLIDAHNNLGYLFRTQSKIDSSLSHYQEAIKYSKLTDNYEGLTNGYIGLGNGYNQLSKWDQAIKEFENAIEVARSMGDSIQVGSAYNNIGNTYLARLIFPKALENYQKSAELGDESIRETSLINMGVVNNMMGNTDEARSYFKEGLEYAEKLNKKNHVAFIHKNLGILEKNSGEFEKSLQHHQQALEHYRSSSDNFSMAETFYNTGNTYFEMEKFEEAISTYNSSIDLYNKIEYPLGVCYSVLALGKTYFEMEEFQLAKENMLEGERCAEEMEILNYQSDSKELLAKIFEKEGNYKKALEYERVFKTLSDSINRLNSKEKIAELDEKYQSTQKQQEIDLLSADNEVAKLSIQKQQSLRNILLISSILLLLLIAALLSRYSIKVKANKKLRELDVVKTNFFTNISHEFRTPLTLIINPLAKLLPTETDRERKAELRLAHSNANRLLELTNQLLNLSKLEAGKIPLQVSNHNLHDFLKRVAASFQSLALTREIGFDENYDLPQRDYFFDADMLEKILNNLLSNAFKFTSENGHVQLKAYLKKDELHLSVSDTGQGLREDDKDAIFERFHQVHDQNNRGGTGVGLTLTKELIQLHKGSISVESELHKGSKFIVTIPIDRSAYLESEIGIGNSQLELMKKAPLNETESLETTQNNPEHPIVLVVEDHPELQHYLKNLLLKNYQVQVASNGKKGLATAKEMVPDLIISDWMMPEMDGQQMCQHLKTDEKTSHIPIILLTAKADKPSKLQGITGGADDYLTKPFDDDELLARVANLIQQRHTLKKKWSTSSLLKLDESSIEDPEKKFLQKALKIVQSHVEDGGFSVEQFQQEIGMSRMQLHRKLKALTNQSTSEFVRSVRLQKAADMLQVNGYHISDVAYQCGFNSVSYFAKCFKEKYGKTPSEFSS